MVHFGKSDAEKKQADKDTEIAGVYAIIGIVVVCPLMILMVVGVVRLIRVVILGGGNFWSN